MSFLEKARQAAEKAAAEASAAAQKAAENAADPAVHAEARLRMAQAGFFARRASDFGRRTLRTMIERIDPGVLADIIIKATALQGRPTRACGRRTPRTGSTRSSSPRRSRPQVNFAIVRIDEGGEEPTGLEVASAFLIDQTTTAPVLALDETAGAYLIEDDETVG
jgi:hypothetical protein